MSKETKKTAAPRLRFPEFKKSGEWLNQPMCELFDFLSTNSLSRDKLNYEGGTVKNIHYGDIHTKFKTLFEIKNELVPYINKSESLERIKPESYCAEGDIVFADASEDLEDIGKSIELVGLNNEKLLSGLHTILARPKEKTFASGFAGYLFKSTPMRSQIQKESQGTKVLGISVKKLANMDLIFPRDKKEQKKIAECLSSIDDFITAQDDKVNTLKNYKKGLLQQLFPQEGEVIPRLRFPEFKKSGEWKAERLDNIADLASGGTPSKDNPKYWGGTIPWISASSMYDIKIKRSGMNVTKAAIGNGTRLAYPRSLLVLVRGSMLFNRIPICILEVEASFNQDVKALTIKNNTRPYFLLYHLISYEQRIPVDKTGIGAGKIDSDELKKLVLYLPPTTLEQEKVSDLLTAIEDQIETQTEKLDVLKLHKNGLLQQLFPLAMGDNDE